MATTSSIGCWQASWSSMRSSLHSAGIVLLAATAPSNSETSDKPDSAIMAVGGVEQVERRVLMRSAVRRAARQGLSAGPSPLFNAPRITTVPSPSQPRRHVILANICNVSASMCAWAWEQDGNYSMICSAMQTTLARLRACARWIESSHTRMIREHSRT
jgi:hypothetical protein